jgi:hypothetical protein
MRKFVLVLSMLIFCFVLKFSCNKKASPLNFIFLEFLNQNDSLKILEFKNATLDSIYSRFSPFQISFNIIYSDKNNYNKISQYLSQNGKCLNIDCHRMAIVYLFYLYLNNIESSLEEAIDFADFNNDIIRKKVEEEDELFERRQLEILKSNYNRYSNGDLIELILPIRIEDGQMTATYCIIYPNEIDCGDAKNSLIVKGHLLNKEVRFKMDSIGNDTVNGIFKIKIHSLSQPRMKIFSNYYRIGDTLRIILSGYGRNIE